MNLRTIIVLAYAYLMHVDGFVPSFTRPQPFTRVMNLSMENNANDISRRNAMKNIFNSLLVTSCSVVGGASPAFAKDKAKETITKEAIAKSFQDVRDELENGGIVELGEKIEKEDFDGIMEFTKEYDLEFRKAKMGKARKFITSKEDKEKAVLLCNAVTFDLIGMNKGSRPGQQNIENVKKYYQEMKEDINSFLEMENLIDYSAYGL